MQPFQIKLNRDNTSMAQLQEAAMKHHTLNFEVCLEDFIYIEYDYSGKIEVKHQTPTEAWLFAGPFKLTWRA